MAALLVVIVGTATMAYLPYTRTPSVKPATAPATVFSAERAMTQMRAVAAKPRPMGSAAHDASIATIQSRLTELGVESQVVEGVATRNDFNQVFAGRLRNVIARIPGTASTGAVAMYSHFDSVPTSMYANDGATNNWTTEHSNPTFAAYVYDADAHAANWKVVGSPVDAWSKQFFPADTRNREIALYPSMPSQPAIIGPAPMIIGLPEPTATVTSDTVSGTNRTIAVAIDAGRPVSSLDVKLTATNPIAGLTLAGRDLTPTNTRTGGEFRVLYIAGETTTGFSVAVTVPRASQLTFRLDQRSSGLPTIPGFTVAARPSCITTATAFESDPTVVLKTVSVR